MLTPSSASSDEAKLVDFLSKATLYHRTDGMAVFDVQYLLKAPDVFIETEPEKVISCPFLRRDVLLAQDRLQRFGTFKLSDYTTDGVLLSYKWERDDAPDASGKALEFAKEYLSAHPTVPGCFIDYSCLPQEPRTQAEQAVFAACLHAISAWYTSFPIISYRVDQRYFESAWCSCESLLASHSQNVAAIAGMMDSEALIVQFLGNQLLQKYLVQKDVIDKICKQFRYRRPNPNQDMEMNNFVQAVFAQVMLRIAHSRAAKASDKLLIIDVMRAFTRDAIHFVADVFPARGIITDIRFENTVDAIVVLDDGSEVRLAEIKTNPRDSFMGLTIVRKERMQRDLTYLFGAQ